MDTGLARTPQDAENNDPPPWWQQRFEQAIVRLRWFPLVNFVVLFLISTPDLDNLLEQVNMMALITTLMLGAVYAVPLTVTQHEVIELMGDGLGASCEDLETFGLNNVTNGSFIGKYGCHVSEWYQDEFCTNPALATTPVNYYYYKPNRFPDPDRAGPNFATPSGMPDLQNTIADAITYNTVTVLLCLLTVASLGMVPTPKAENNFAIRRRGAVGRRKVITYTGPHPGLAGWWKVGKFALLGLYVMAYTSIIKGNSALNNMLQMKFPFTITSDICMEQGWQFSHRDPETNSARYTGGKFVRLNPERLLDKNYAQSSGVSADTQFMSMTEKDPSPYGIGALPMEDLPCSHMDFDTAGGDWYKGASYRDFGTLFENYRFQPTVIMWSIGAVFVAGYMNQWAMVAYETELADRAAKGGSDSSKAKAAASNGDFGF